MRSNGEINDPTQPVDGKVLGTTWQSRKDTISFPVKAESPRNWTKRTLFKSVATLFDPLGLIAPYVIVGKIMIQELWKKGLEWDEPIDDSLKREVAQWWGEVQELESLLFPRFVGPTSSPVTVHMFADASEKSIRLRDLSGNERRHFSYLCKSTGCSTEVRIISSTRAAGHLSWL